MATVCDCVLCLFDSLLAIFVFSPIVVGYWRGCWQLMDLYLFSYNKIYSIWASLAIGLGLGIFFGIAQHCLTRSFPRGKRKCLFVILSRLYTAISCFACVNHWRGIWYIWDEYHNDSWESGAKSAVIGVCLLAFTRGLRNILAPPFYTDTDHREGYFVVPTLFKAKKDNCCSFLMDILYTVVINGSLIVFVWRGSWVFLDRLLFPDNVAYSAWASLIIGIFVTVMCFLSQIIMIPCLKSVTNKLMKIILEDIYILISFLGAVTIWRGVWNLLNVYLYPERIVLSNLITAVGGNLALMFLFNGNSILVRGAEMDGTSKGAAGVTFQTHYFRSFFKKDKTKGEFDLWKAEETKGSPKKVSLIDQINAINVDSIAKGNENNFSSVYGEPEKVVVNSPLDISKEDLADTVNESPVKIKLLLSEQINYGNMDSSQCFTKM